MPQLLQKQTSLNAFQTNMFLWLLSIFKKNCHYICPYIKQILFELNLLMLPIKPEK